MYIEPLMIGCSKFYCEPGVIKLLPAEIREFGSKALLVGGETTLKMVCDQLEDCADLTLDCRVHQGECSYKWAETYKDIVKEKGYDVIVGIGGGKIIDLIKCAAVFGNIPLITVPTSVATCAPSSMVCIMYDEQGKCDGSVNLKKEIDVCIADPNLIATAPKRLLASGMLDSMAKLPETLQKFGKIKKEDYSVKQTIINSNSRDIFEFLLNNAEHLYQEGANSPKFTDVIMTNLIHTSLVSGFAAGSGQLAIAHAVYNNLRTYFTESARDYLHGEMVAVGILVQMHFNGNPLEEIISVRDLMAKLNMPCTLKAIGYIDSSENFELLCKVICEDTGIETVEDQDLLKQAMRFAL